VVLFAALSSLVMACGDDDDGDDAAAATTVAGDAGDSTAAEGSTAAGGGEYCTALAAFKTSTDEFVAVVASGTATPEQTETAITEHGLAFRALLDAAPADIQGDLGALAGPTDSFIDALAEVEYDVGSLTTENAAVAEALNQLDGPDYIEATESVDAYGLENCGITIGNWQPVGP
jgi:hypothetical protein